MKLRKDGTVDPIVQMECPRVDISSEGDIMSAVSSRTKRTIVKISKELEHEDRVNYRTIDLPNDCIKCIGCLCSPAYGTLERKRWQHFL